MKVYAGQHAAQNVDERRPPDRSRRPAKAGKQLVDRCGDRRAAGNGGGGTKHKALLARLTGLAEQEDGDDAAAINSLRQQLLALKVTGRQNINLDPDEVRVTEKGNPALEGDYTLWLPAQPSTITVMGLISSPGKTVYSPRRGELSRRAEPAEWCG